MADRWVTLEEAIDIFHVDGAKILALIEMEEIDTGPAKTNRKGDSFKTVAYSQLKSRFELRDKSYHSKNQLKNDSTWFLLGLAASEVVGLIKDTEKKKPKSLPLKNSKPLPQTENPVQSSNAYTIKNLRELRLSKGLSLPELARICEVSRMTIMAIEQDKGVRSDTANLVRKQLNQTICKSKPIPMSSVQKI